MRLDLFDYRLPPDRIAARPTADREGARLLVTGPGAHLGDDTVRSIPDLVERGALVVLNDTRVIPARLLGTKSKTGGKVELLLVRRTDEPVGAVPELAAGAFPAERWRALGKSSKPLRFPVDVLVGERGELDVRVLGRAADGLLDVVLASPAGLSIDEALSRWGHVPLPPYVHRPDEPGDRERYQTVFARRPGAVAAPTAGLHLTEATLGRFALRDVKIATVTLHVGLGTFQPVTVDDFDAHVMHEEWIEVPQAVVDAVAQARARGAPVVAIGTTVVRALESAADASRPGHVVATRGPTRLLIQPGYSFQVVDSLMTNFHLPRSTLMALVCAFGGRTRVLDAYAYAVEHGYRFYSYGDAMWLPERVDPALAAR